MTSDVCFTDMLATFAALVDAKLPDNAGEDSYNLLPLLLGEKRATPLRKEMVIGTDMNNFNIRHGDWKLIPFLGSGGMSKPSKIKPKPGEPAGQLYNLANDPSETTNLYLQHPEIVAELTTLFEQMRGKARSRP